MSARRRQRRSERAARHSGRTVVLNIVSLIDVFAILVFYLLVNALTVEIIPSPQALKLPESVSREQPRTTVTLIVTRENILVDNKPVMSTAQAMASGSKPLAPLKSALLLQPLMPGQGVAGNPSDRGEINILADKSIPFRVLRKVMGVCGDAHFARISLAVIEKRTGRAP